MPSTGCEPHHTVTVPSRTALDELQGELAAFLGFAVPPAREVEWLDPSVERGYRRTMLRYPSSEGDAVTAYLLVPEGDGPFPGLLVHHQHNSEYHLGKSEPVGMAGDPLQAFGPALARRGVVVLAPDSICFEDRRHQGSGLEPDEASDRLQHHNEFAYRLLTGDLLSRKVLLDSALAVSVLGSLPAVRSDRVGMLGHSYGGSTVLFHAPLDSRIRFASASGSACTYRTRMAAGTGIELAQIIPGFTQRFDLDDLVRCMAPRPLLIASATGDPYSQDADAIETAARPAYAALGAGEALEHLRVEGGHRLTVNRFRHIIEWTWAQCTA